jgi:hypothetical protein
MTEPPIPSVETRKVAEVEPAGTVTIEGTVAAAVLSLVNEIRTPPAGAAPVNVTVPVTTPPEMTGDAPRDNPASAAVP